MTITTSTVPALERTMTSSRLLDVRNISVDYYAANGTVHALDDISISLDRIHSYPHELSGGMRQRAMIAISLALSPELVIMDEPTTALDVVVQREILTEIIGLSKRLNFSVIFITHDLSLLLEVANKI